MTGLTRTAPTAPPRTARRGLTHLAHLAVTVIGMSGLRLDRPEHRVVRATVWASVLAAGLAAEELLRDHAGSTTMQRAAVGYAVAIAVLYYGGLITVLHAPTADRLRARFGHERAIAGFDFALGLLFLQQALCQSLLMAAFPGRLPQLAVPGAWAMTGALLAVVGFGTKLWAAWLTGLDTYYCRDMLLGRATGPDGFVVRGPYRWLRNPMYGVGNLHGYGVALWYGSPAGLVCVAAFQALIYTFYFLREKPFIVRTYLNGAAGTSPPGCGN